MASTETEWTREDPKVDGVYWWRADRTDFEPDIHYVSNGKFYEAGEQFSRIVEGFGGEWLGPISPSDAEQLIQLRKLTDVSLDLLLDICDSRAIERFSAIGKSRIKSHIQDLRSVLTPKQEKETQ